MKKNILIFILFSITVLFLLIQKQCFGHIESDSLVWGGSNIYLLLFLLVSVILTTLIIICDNILNQKPIRYISIIILFLFLIYTLLEYLQKNNRTELDDDIIGLVYFPIEFQLTSWFFVVLLIMYNIYKIRNLEMKKP